MKIKEVLALGLLFVIIVGAGVAIDRITKKDAAEDMRQLICETPAGAVELNLRASNIANLGDTSPTYTFTAPNGDVVTVSKSMCVVIKEAKPQSQGAAAE